MARKKVDRSWVAAGGGAAAAAFLLMVLLELLVLLVLLILAPAVAVPPLAVTARMAPTAQSKCSVARRSPRASPPRARSVLNAFVSVAGSSGRTAATWRWWLARRLRPGLLAAPLL